MTQPSQLNGRTASSVPKPPAERSLRRVLGVPGLVVFGLAYMVPLTIFTTYGLVTTMTEGHLPAAYVVTLAAMIFTALSYAFLVRVIPSAGSAYSFTQRIFGSHVGFVTGWTLMLDYLLLPLINYLLIGLYLNAQFPAVPMWVFTLSAIALVTVLNLVGISVVKSANLVLVGMQAVFVVVFVILTLSNISTGQSLLAPFFSADMQLGLVLSGAAILCLSFLGFDAVSTMSEEAKDPRRTVPRAVLLTTLIGGSMFILVAWVAHLAFPNWQDFTDPDAAAVQIMNSLGGNLMAAFFLAAYIAGSVGSALASQASVSRILYAMGRDAVIPRSIFGVLHRRFGTPVGAIVVVSVVSLLALVLDLATVASVISFGALFAFSLVNLGAVKHFILDERRTQGRDLLKYGVVPSIGFLLTVWLWFSLSPAAFSVGLVWLLIGVVYLVVLTRGFRRPPPQVDLDETTVDGAPTA
ncbi:APC family permease [Arthrobacter sp. D2-10]